MLKSILGRYVNIVQDIIFLTNRIVNEWNTLSREVIESKDVNEFKNKLDKEFK